MRVIILIFVSTLISSCSTEPIYIPENKGPVASNVETHNTQTSSSEGSYQGIDMTNVTKSVREKRIGSLTGANDKIDSSRNYESPDREKDQDKEQPLEIEKINAAYKAALKTNKCEKQFWSRYEYGNYFQSLATKYKLSPYDIFSGSAYDRRNISQFVWNEAYDNSSKYIAFHFPDVVSKKFDQEFSSDVEKKKNEKAVFNLQVKRDYECYIKLK